MLSLENLTTENISVLFWVILVYELTPHSDFELLGPGIMLGPLEEGLRFTLFPSTPPVELTLIEGFWVGRRPVRL